MSTTESLPGWVTDELIKTTLEQHFKDVVDVCSISSRPAVPTGDNYTSELYRTTVRYKTAERKESQAISLIIKCVPDSDSRRMMAAQLQLFEKETDMFTVILPKMHQIYDGNCFGPECLLAEKEPNGIMIMEDLATHGYKMASRQNGLDMDQCFLVLEKLAKWHATTALLHLREPSQLAGYEKGFFNNQHGNKVIEHIVLAAFNSLIVAASKWPGCKKYADRLLATAENLFKRTCEVGRRDDTQFNVLNHGDMWINNILFQYDDKNRLKDLKFVDFQLSVFCSPAVDLQYFMYTSPRHDIWKKHQDRLIQYYHEQLEINLRDLGYPEERIPSWEMIRGDYYKRGFYGLVSAALVLPVIRSPPRKDATFEDLARSGDEENGLRHFLYNGPEYKAIMQDMLPYFDKHGLLD